MKSTKKSSFRLIYLFMAVMLPFEPISADVVKQLYEAEMPVETQSREEREYVARVVLRDVFIRASGRTAAGEIAKNTELVPNPTPFMQQFRYLSFTPDDIIPDSPDGAKPYTQKLWIRFNQKVIHKLLREQGYPVWGKTRPATLVWLVIDDQKQRILVGNNTPHIARTQLEMEAKKRGLPLRMPLLDLADQSKLRVTDVWGNFEDTILDASQRYQTESILVGRVYLSYAKTWHARWSWYSAGQRLDWESQGSDQLRTVMSGAIAYAGEALSTRFAQIQNSETSNSVLVKIQGISNLSLYNRAVKYLSGLNIVKKVQPQEVSQDHVVFQVTSHSGRLGVAQAISLGHVLVTDISKPVDIAVLENKKMQYIQADLTYKLIP